ncbi:MAG: IS3 family transposase [Candidatus Brachytrichaceae bacterium NZ_4S206]|jgi:transposase InsO family protein
MNQHTGEYPVREMCRVLQVSRRGYYAWRARRTRSISKRQKANDDLLQAIRDVHDSSKQRFGAYKVYRKLRQLGWRCGRHRVARLMRQNGLQSKRVARFKVTTRAQHHRPVAPNVLKREFTYVSPVEFERAYAMVVA